MSADAETSFGDPSPEPYSGDLATIPDQSTLTETDQGLDGRIAKAYLYRVAKIARELCPEGDIMPLIEPGIRGVEIAFSDIALPADLEDSITPLATPHIDACIRVSILASLENPVQYEADA